MRVLPANTDQESFNPRLKAESDVSSNTSERQILEARTSPAYLMGFNWPDARELPEQRRRRHRPTSGGNRPPHCSRWRNPKEQAGSASALPKFKTASQPNSTKITPAKSESQCPRERDPPNDGDWRLCKHKEMDRSRFDGPQRRRGRNLDVAIPSKVFSTSCLSLTSASTFRFGQPKEPSPMVATHAKKANSP